MAIHGALRQRSYALILASSENKAEIEQAEIRMMLARGVDALLLASCQPSLQGFFTVHDLNTPLVLVDRPFPQLRVSFVGTDDYAGGRLATEHLIQLGRKRLAYIGSPDLSPAADRYRGFRHALRDHDVELNEALVVSSEGEEPADKAGYDRMAALLTRRSRPDGVLCHNDVVAIGAMRAAQDAVSGSGGYGCLLPGERERPLRDCRNDLPLILRFIAIASSNRHHPNFSTHQLHLNPLPRLEMDCLHRRSVTYPGIRASDAADGRRT